MIALSFQQHFWPNSTDEAAAQRIIEELNRKILDMVLEARAVNTSLPLDRLQIKFVTPQGPNNEPLPSQIQLRADLEHYPTQKSSQKSCSCSH